MRGAQVFACAAVALILALPAVSQAQQATPSGEELYIDRLGCWNCHGSAGEGGSGPGLAKTQLPLSKFVRVVRMPSGEMPPYAPALASDTDLAILYRWLDGVDAVHAPPSIAFALKAAPHARADGQATADTEVEVTARTQTATPGVDAPKAASLRYRLTLLSRTDGPVANRKIEYQPAGREGLSTFTTDEHGQGLLGPDAGLLVAAVGEADKEGPAGRLRMVLPAGRYALVVEAISDAESAKPIVVGVGTAVFSVE